MTSMRIAWIGAGRMGLPICKRLKASGHDVRILARRPEQAEKFSDLELVNLLGVSLPFHPAEKQALLEAATLKDRENMLVDLLRLGAGPIDPTDDSTPRTLN